MRVAASGIRRAGTRRAGKPDSTDVPLVVPPAFASLKAVNQSRDPLTYGLIYPWGCSSPTWSSAFNGSGAPRPVDLLWAYPGLFVRACTIREITISNICPTYAPGVGIRYKLGLYANYADGVPFPGALLATMPAYAGGTYLIAGNTTWAVNLPVAAGTLLWLVQTCDGGPAATLSQANLNQGNLSDSALVLGMTDDIYTPGGQIRFRFWRAYGWECPRVYDDALPATFPTVATVPISDNNLTGSSMPFWAMRLGP